MKLERLGPLSHTHHAGVEETGWSLWGRWATVGVHATMQIHPDGRVLGRKPYLPSRPGRPRRRNAPTQGEASDGDPSRLLSPMMHAALSQ